MVEDDELQIIQTTIFSRVFSFNSGFKKSISIMKLFGNTVLPDVAFVLSQLSSIPKKEVPTVPVAARG